MGISVCWSFKLELTVTNICRNALLSQPLKDQHVCLCCKHLRVSLLYIQKQMKAILAALMATVAKSLISVCKHLPSVSASEAAAVQLLCFHAVCIMESEAHHLD